MKKEVSCFYYTIYEDFKNQFGLEVPILRGEAARHITRCHRIKKEIADIILQEMINVGLLKKDGSYNITVGRLRKNPLDKLNLLAHKVGIW